MPDLRYPSLARRFGDALRVGDPTQADLVVREALAAHAPPAAVQSLVIAPAMTRIRELRQADIVSVAEEHLATSICQRALVHLYAVLSAARSGGPHRERVLLAAIGGQSPVLGLQMVADVLDGAGFDVVYLGGDVPIEDLRALVEDRRPSVVGLTFGIVSRVSRLADAVLAIHDASPETRIMLGGLGVPIGLREAGYPWLSNSMDVVRTVEDLVAGPPQVASEILGALGSGGTGEPAPQETGIETDAIAEQFARIADDATDVVRQHLRSRADAPADVSPADPLTGVLGHGAILERLRDATGMVLVVDVGDLRPADGGHGRQVGEALLRAVAHVMRDVLRPTDVIARTAGNELMAVLPGATRDSAERVAERLRAAIAAGTAPQVTFRVRAASSMHELRPVLLSAATALYTVKAARTDPEDADDVVFVLGDPPDGPGPGAPVTTSPAPAPASPEAATPHGRGPWRRTWPRGRARTVHTR